MLTTQVDGVLVVDDGSTDGTSCLAEDAGARVVRHSRNLGYDAAIATGLASAVEAGAVAVVTLDADGQHDPATVGRVLAALTDADLVVGIRDRRQRISEVAFGWWGRRRLGIRDPLCGLKAYRADLLRSVGCGGTRPSIGTEVLVDAVVDGARVAEVPIPTGRRHEAASRFGGGWSAERRILVALCWAVRVAGLRRVGR